ncbi:hypothetical protein K0B04_01370 [Patescibacteria group bacterium]|nr:hypothetical protein [Patescibacteria group bacterium]
MNKLGSFVIYIKESRLWKWVVSNQKKLNTFIAFILATYLTKEIYLLYREISKEVAFEFNVHPLYIHSIVISAGLFAFSLFLFCGMLYRAIKVFLVPVVQKKATCETGEEYEITYDDTLLKILSVLIYVISLSLLLTLGLR